MNPPLISAGAGSFTFNGNRARLIPFVKGPGDTVAVVVKNVSDPHNNEVRLNLTIQEPSQWSLGPFQDRLHVAGMAHAAFKSALQIQNPNNVSFDNLEVREGVAIPELTGRYATAGVNAGNHHANTFPLAAAWLRIGTQRADPLLQAAASPNHIAVGIDTVGSHTWAAPFTDNGTFTWKIPWIYRLSIPANQLFDVDNRAVLAPDLGFRKTGAVATHLENLVGNSMTVSKGGRGLTYTAVDLPVGNAAVW